MSEIRYLKIIQTDGVRYILRVTRETPAVITGIEVDAEGEEIVPRGIHPKIGEPYHQRERKVMRDAIKKAVEMRMNPKYATLEIASAEKQPKTTRQLDADIAEALKRHDHATRTIPSAVKTAIEQGALEIINGSYRRHAAIGGKEPCISVGIITDYLRQAYMPEEFRWAPKNQQRTWTRSVLESMRRKGQIGSSFGAAARCYEPRR